MLYDNEVSDEDEAVAAAMRAFAATVCKDLAGEEVAA